MGRSQYRDYSRAVYRLFHPGDPDHLEWIEAPPTGDGIGWLVLFKRAREHGEVDLFQLYWRVNGEEQKSAILPLDDWRNWKSLPMASANAEPAYLLCMPNQPGHMKPLSAPPTLAGICWLEPAGDDLWRLCWHTDEGMIESHPKPMPLAEWQAFE